MYMHLRYTITVGIELVILRLIVERLFIELSTSALRNIFFVFCTRSCFVATVNNRLAKPLAFAVSSIQSFVCFCGRFGGHYS